MRGDWIWNLKSAALPPNEDQRLERLRDFEVLDTTPDQAFDQITMLAAAICGTPVALMSLVDGRRLWFKSRQGMAAVEISREIAFCAHAILCPDEVMVVPDTTLDERFQDNPLTTDAASPVRFYAGSPIVTEDGLAVGTICVIDHEVRALSPDQVLSLKSLSSLASTLLERGRLQRNRVRLAEDQMQQDTAVMRALLTSGRDIKSFVDLQYVYQFVNPAYLDYWDREPSEIVGQSVAAIVGQEQFERVIRQPMDRALAGENVEFEAVLEFPRLGKRAFEVTYQPAWGEDGKIFGIVVRAQDVQIRKERETQFQETMRMLEQRTIEQERFIHIISHDLREPINTINNFTSLLASSDEMQWPGEARRYLDFVRNGGLRMERLLDDLLKFVRLNPEVMTLQQVDLSQLVDEVRADLALSLEHAGGEIIVDSLQSVWGDPTLLRLLLQNLVSNALKFARLGAPPVVVITCRDDEDAVYLSVRDNGIGIPADKIDTAFEMFRRLNHKKKYPGTGLGLSICRRVAELHGGSITAESTVDEGSCFTLRLPKNSLPKQEPA